MYVTVTGLQVSRPVIQGLLFALPIGVVFSAFIGKRNKVVYISCVQLVRLSRSISFSNGACILA